jgi:pSer/pThr/pTyr-binding forkhead associated (FHA) protein
VVFPAAMRTDVSAVHACFVWEPGRRTHWRLRDLSSSGTWLNGQRIAKGQHPERWRNGARVDLGGPDINRFTIEIPGAPTLAVMEDPR